MMPEMNGFDLCRKIKSDIVLSHLPVMLLTALSDDKQQMFGAASGADAYIRKPFNIEIVKLRIIKLLEDRARLREAYVRDASSPTVSVKAEKAGSMDDLFMSRFLKLIEESYADPDFSIEKGSEKLGLSRVHLYRKVKELAGVTPTDFLRNYRLKKAAALLRRKAGNVNEVAYATASDSPAYFSKVLKPFIILLRRSIWKKNKILPFGQRSLHVCTSVHVNLKISALGTSVINPVALLRRIRHRPLSLHRGKRNYPCQINYN